MSHLCRVRPFRALKSQMAQAVQLKKGEYTIRVFLRHDSASLLGQMKGLPLVVERQLGEPVTVPVYGSNRDAVRKTNPCKERVLHPGEC